jgi:hypothetical protein
MVGMGDTETKQIGFGIPFSLRREPKTVEDFTLDNQFAILPFMLPLTTDFKEGLKTIKAGMDAMKDSPSPFGYYYLIVILMYFPRTISQTLLEVYSGKCTFAFSNVPGPRAPYVVVGSKVKHMSFFVPQMLKVCGGFSIMSHYDTVKLGIMLDKTVADRPEELMEMFEAKFDEVFGSKEWRNFKPGQ